MSITKKIFAFFMLAAACFVLTKISCDAQFEQAKRIVNSPEYQQWLEVQRARSRDW